MEPSLYGELRRIAARQLNTERLNHTLQPTALVHEAYLKLSGERERSYSDDSHFLAVASRVMRQILVDHARSRCAQKRLGDRHFSLSDVTVTVSCESGLELNQLLQLDDALDALAAEDETLARLVEMRYFGGMTAEESAEVLGISAHIVRHYLRYAQTWLRRRLDPRLQSAFKTPFEWRHHGRNS
jgi:RNA polymerase sigma factor (TIGR02999 family)